MDSARSNDELATRIAFPAEKVALANTRYFLTDRGPALLT
jgi:hypothetical protein